MISSVAILGAGESGIGAALLAKKENIDVFVSDFGAIASKYKQELINNNIPFEEMGHSFERLEKSDLIVKSPGIPDKAEIVKQFRLRHKEIISEIEWASRFYDGKIIAITGSNGKTTTTSLIHHIIKESKESIGLGGNIGHSFARLVASDLDYDWVVLELSSFQLDGIILFRPDVAVILNITPDHLDRYNYEMSLYAQAKWRITMNQTENDVVVINKNDDWSNKLLSLKSTKAKVVKVAYNKNEISCSTEEGINVADLDLKLPGEHNLFNAKVATEVACRYGLDKRLIIAGLESFQGISHRLEYVISVNDVKYINDSKATNVESAQVALESYTDGIIWIAGGVDKGNDYSLIKEVVTNRVKLIICLTLNDAPLRAAFESETKIITTSSMEDAILISENNAVPGNVVLLSPACASFDLFRNYEDRGDKFKEAVNKLEKNTL